MNILIPNGSSVTNIGDLAILTSLVHLIKNANKKNSIVLHSTDPDLHKSKNFSQIRETLYSYVAFEKLDTDTRVFRLLKLIVYYFLLRLGLLDKLVTNNDQLFQIYADYQKADLILFTGGGYLRSKPGFTQTINLLMQLFMLHVGNTIGKKKIIAPISFGPFAYVWQEKLAAKVLAGFDEITVREHISYQILKNYQLKKLTLSTDLALLIQKKSTVKPTQKVGFTLLNYYQGQQQIQLETAFIEALTQFATKYKLSVVPIIQVENPLFPTENDTVPVTRVYSALRERGISVESPIRLTNLDQAIQVYGNLSLLLGMRMHSTILSAIAQVPFVAVGYEYKAEGIAKTLQMSDYYIEAKNISLKNLYQKLISAYKTKSRIKKILSTQIDTAKKHEISFWKKQLL